jgi:LCP family protein required for cell wall assembly
VLVLLGLLVAGAVAAAVTLSRTDLVALAVDPTFLAVTAAGLGLLAVVVLANAVASHHLLQPAGIRRGQRFVGAVVVMLVSSLVVTPVALASRYALAQYDLVTTVFIADGDTDDTQSVDGEPIPDPEPAVDPWAGVDRVNVLLLGSDAGPDREGTRPDTAIVASIAPATGDAVLFSLPRNLENVPFPNDSLLSAYYPYGWQGDPTDLGSELLNAVYRYVPAAHPELFDDVDDPGAEAMKLAAEGATGLPIDYYVMVDLDGFQQVVDALGGIDLNVSQRIPLESSMLPAGYCSQPTGYIEPGQQRLNGYEALWYARARCGGEGLSNDFDRMRRQRCVIGAMIDRADPITVLGRYQSLAGAAQRIVTTDIPQQMVPAFAELGLRVQGAAVRTLPFTDKVIVPADPDYAEMRRLVSDALAPPPPVVETPPQDTEGSTDGAPSDSDEGSGSTGGTETTPGNEGTGTTGDAPDEPDESDGVLQLDEVC